MNQPSLSIRHLYSQYLETLSDQRTAKNNLTNALVRYAVPALGGPIPEVAKRRRCNAKQIEAGLSFLNSQPASLIHSMVDNMNQRMAELKLSAAQRERSRRALRDLTRWVIEQDLLEPTVKIPQMDINTHPWGFNSDGVTPKGAAELYEEYLATLTQRTERSDFKNAIARFFVPAVGGPMLFFNTPVTAAEIEAAVDYLRHHVNSSQLLESSAIASVALDAYDLSQTQKTRIRTTLKKFRDWCQEQTYLPLPHEVPPVPWDDDETRDLKPIQFNTFYTNGNNRLYEKVDDPETGESKMRKRRELTPGVEQYNKSAPAHTLGAKVFPGDYINDYLKQQLDDYTAWREFEGIRPGSIKSEVRQIKQFLGWMVRYKNVSLADLRFESFITKNQLLVNSEEELEMDEDKIFMHERKLFRKAKRSADLDYQKAEEYLAFGNLHPASKSRYIHAMICIAKFVYRRERGTDEFAFDRYIPILRRLLTLQRKFNKQEKETGRSIPLHKNLVSWDSVILLMEKLRQRADCHYVYNRRSTAKGREAKSRPNSAVANDLQKFLGLAFMVNFPSRSRTYYELEIGRTFCEGLLVNEGLANFIPVDNLEDRQQAKFYISHSPEDFKSGKNFAAESEYGWWAELENTRFPNGQTLYDYIRRWLDWGRHINGPVEHNFFFRRCHNTQPIDVDVWRSRNRLLFETEFGVPVPPRVLRQIYATNFTLHSASEAAKRGAACALQHDYETHQKKYDMASTIRIMKPAMEFNNEYIQKVLQQNSTS